jgi:hypothetical protein
MLSCILPYQDGRMRFVVVAVPVVSYRERRAPAFLPHTGRIYSITRKKRPDRKANQRLACHVCAVVFQFLDTREKVW